MKFTFYKYQGTGNDFILIDNRNLQFPAENAQLIEELCNRRMGVGADGLMLLQSKEGFDFEMVYFNSDGQQSSMCGNGGRCITAFAKYLGIIEYKARFIAIDGPHNAVVNGNNVQLQMINVSEIENNDDHYFLDTGSPHYVEFVEDVDNMNLVEEAQKIRYNERFKTEGTNVNFVSTSVDSLKVRTYERGVEGETLSCGTGATAVAIAAHQNGFKMNDNHYPLAVKGGQLEVRFDSNDNSYSNVWLIGPATFVFKGELEV